MKNEDSITIHFPKCNTGTSGPRFWDEDKGVIFVGEEKSISILGKGPTETIIVNDKENDDFTFFYFYCTNCNITIHGIGFVITDHEWNSSWSTNIDIEGTGNNVIISDNSFEFDGIGVKISGLNNSGVISRNNFYFKDYFDYYGEGIKVSAESSESDFGQEAWEYPLNLSSLDSIYIENNNFYQKTKAVALNALMGARVVFRNNFIQNTRIYFCGVGGENESQSNRGAISFEIYNNTFEVNEDESDNFDTFIEINGGTGVIFNNTADIKYNVDYVVFFISFDIERAMYVHDKTAWGDFKSCSTNMSEWDNSKKIVINTSITHEGIDNVEYLENNFFSDHHLYDEYNGIIIRDLVDYSLRVAKFANESKIYLCTNELCIKDGDNKTNYNIRNNHSYELFFIDSCLDQPGVAVKRNCIKNGEDTYTCQSHVPIYIWNNVIHGDDFQIVSNDNIDNVSFSNLPQIQKGRNYILEELSDYSIFAFPHPWDYFAGDNDDSVPTSNGLLDSDFLIIIIVGVSMLFLLIFVCFVVLFIIIIIITLKKKNREKRKSVEEILENESKQKVLDFKIDNRLFNVDYESIKVNEKIGAGGSNSIIFSGKLSGNDIAFKCFKISDFESESTYKEFEKEVSLLAGLAHPFIVRFYGATLKIPRIGIVLEFCPHGSIDNYLKNNSVDFSSKVNYLLQICYGMEYLHSHNVIHRDLKPQNVLIGGDLKIRIIDFGLSRFFDKMDVGKTKHIGTSYYMAPEIVRGEDYDSKVDVFSFGMMAFEIISGNFNPFNRKSSTFNIEWKIAGDEQMRPKFDEKEWKNIQKWIIDLIKRLWSNKPDNRPTFSEVIKEIEPMCKK